MRWIGVAVASMALAFACGGGSGGGGPGVSGSKKIIELSPAETEDVCDFLADLLGPEREIDCGEGATVRVGGADAAECVAEFSDLQSNAPDCMLTVGQYETCIRAIGAMTDSQWCSQMFPSECAGLFDSACSSDDF
jgi:hypothetical protein